MSTKQSFKAFKYSNSTKKLEIYSSVGTFFFLLPDSILIYSQDHNLKLEIGSKFLKLIRLGKLSSGSQ